VSYSFNDYGDIGKNKDYYPYTNKYSDLSAKKYSDLNESKLVPISSASNTITSTTQNKQTLKTDPKALLPIFSGETKYYREDEPSQVVDKAAKVVVGKKENVDDIFNKFSNLTPNEITLKSNVGKALYAGSMATNSSGAVFYQELENCKKKGIQFIDRDFPASMDSLAGKCSDFRRSCGNVTWKRGDALFKEKKFKLFEGKIEPRDILQG
jgi:hypothetical protein